MDETEPPTLLVALRGPLELVVETGEFPDDDPFILCANGQYIRLTSGAMRWLVEQIPTALETYTQNVAATSTGEDVEPQTSGSLLEAIKETEPAESEDLEVRDPSPPMELTEEQMDALRTAVSRQVPKAMVLSAQRHGEEAPLVVKVQAPTLACYPLIKGVLQRLTDKGDFPVMALYLDTDD